MRKVDLIVVHCSDSDHKHHDNLETIRNWHVKENGWSDIGYHYFITKDGLIHPGRPLKTPGAHVAGHNAHSIGICLSGKHEFTKEQMASLEKLCFDLCKTYGLEKSDILGHRDLQPLKTCPNFDIHKEISSWGWH